ncbi:MAG: hypothetical protein LBH98_05975 [Chitinispirillales bacterium]|nr:hypothetical protein [Chitinispirillales bacterium]
MKKKNDKINDENHDEALKEFQANKNIVLFDALKSAKTVSEIFQSDLSIAEKYPLETLIMEIETAQEMCKVSADWKTWLSMQNTKLKYLHKSAEYQEESKRLFTAEELANAIRKSQNDG